MQLIRTSTGPLHEFQLIDNQNIKEVLRYNPQQQSARIQLEGQRRVFFVESAAFRNNHIRLKNEYGLTIGTLIFERGHEHHECVLEIDGRKFQCMYHSRPGAELAIYEQHSLRPLVTCGVESIDWMMAESFIRREPARQEYASLLLGLCWYLLLTHPQEAQPLEQLQAIAEA